NNQYMTREARRANAKEGGWIYETCRKRKEIFALPLMTGEFKLRSYRIWLDNLDKTMMNEDIVIAETASFTPETDTWEVSRLIKEAVLLCQVSHDRCVVPVLSKVLSCDLDRDHQTTVIALMTKTREGKDALKDYALGYRIMDHEADWKTQGPILVRILGRLRAMPEMRDGIDEYIRKIPVAFLENREVFYALYQTLSESILDARDDAPSRLIMTAMMRKDSRAPLQAWINFISARASAAPNTMSLAAAIVTEEEPALEEIGSFIGKLKGLDGNIIESGVRAVLDDGGRQVAITHRNMKAMSVPLYLEDNEPVIRSGTQMQAMLDDFIREHRPQYEGVQKYLDSILPKLKGLFSGVDRVMALAHNGSVQGVAGTDAAHNKIIYLNIALIEHPLALIHEYTEGLRHEDLMKIMGLPENSILTNHTAARGAGKDARNALMKIKDTDKKDADTIIRELGELMMKTRALTPSEEALMRYNADVLGLKGERLLYGLQDILDPSGNLRFSQDIRVLTDSMRRGVMNIFLMPKAADAAMVNEEQKIGQKGGSIFSDKYALATRVKHYLDSDLKDMLAEACEQVSANPALYPKIFVECISRKQVDVVNEFLTMRPDAASYIVIGNDNMEGMKGPVVDEMKVIVVGSALLNDKRLCTNFELGAEDPLIVRTRTEMVRFLVSHGIIGPDFDGIDLERAESYTSGLLEKLMTAICAGLHRLAISKIDFKEIDDFNRSQREILKAL
ncbi:MAG: hypothetical protein PHS37_09835, partial [Candidatus Omnitrophica bacterium]|nr:hypothetical protein [Candidatus Omnitrophota bacterium]